MSEIVPDSAADWLAGLPLRSKMVVSEGKARISWRGGQILLPFDTDLSSFGEGLAAERSRLPRGLSLDVVLPTSAALVRTHRLPSSSRGRLHQILALDLTRDTPLSPEEVVWKERIIGQEEGEILVDQLIVKRSILHELRQIFSANHILPGKLFVRTTEEDQPLVIFEDRDARSEAAGIWPKVNWALAAGLVTCLTLLIVQPYLRDAEKVENLTRERAELTQQLVELRTKVNEKSEGIGAADRIARALDDRVPRVDILRELTVRLRDDAWLSDVEISEDLLRFSGFTKGSAADLVIDLASSPHFFNPRLTGQVSIAPGTGAERYEISLDLTGESE